MAAFDAVKGIYEYYNNTFGSLGLNLDLEYIETTRPEIAAMLQKQNKP